MPAREDVSCQRWQLINIYKSTRERIRANDRSAGAFARELGRGEKGKNESADQCHWKWNPFISDIGSKQREQNDQGFEARWFLCQRKDTLGIILITCFVNDTARKMVRASVLHFHAAGCSRCRGILDFRRNFESNNFRRSVIFELFIYRFNLYVFRKEFSKQTNLIIMLSHDIIIVKDALSISVLQYSIYIF